jgi:hypothetical protein
VPPQPPLGETKIRARGLDQAPETTRVILLLQVHQFMQQDVVAYRRRHLHEPIVERNPSSARARSPSRPLVSNRQSGDPQAMIGGQRVKPRGQLAARQRAQVVLDAAAEVIGAVHEDGPFAVSNDSPAARIDADLHRHHLPSQHHRRSVRPRGRDTRGVDAGALGRDPGAMAVQEPDRFGARAASRNGDANRAVRPDADYVAPGAAHSDEFDTRRRGNRFDFRAKKGQIELHERCGPMITQSIRPPTRRR